MSTCDFDQYLFMCLETNLCLCKTLINY